MHCATAIGLCAIALAAHSAPRNGSSERFSTPIGGAVLTADRATHVPGAQVDSALHHPQRSAPLPINTGACSSPTLARQRREQSHEAQQRIVTPGFGCRCGSQLYQHHSQDCPMAPQSSECFDVKSATSKCVGAQDCRVDREAQLSVSNDEEACMPHSSHSQPVSIQYARPASVSGMHSSSLPSMPMFMSRYGLPVATQLLFYGSFGRHSAAHGMANAFTLDQKTANVKAKSYSGREPRTEKKCLMPLKESTLAPSMLKRIEQAIDDRNWETIMKLVSCSWDGAKYRRHICNCYDHLCGILVYYCGKEIESARGRDCRLDVERWQDIQAELACARNAWIDANKNTEIVCGLQAYAPAAGLHPFLDGTRFLIPYEPTYSAFDELMRVHIVPRVSAPIGEECSYCLDSLLLDPSGAEKHLVVLPCGHTMCINCARMVLSTKARCVECCLPAINDAEEVLGQNDIFRSPFYLPENAILVIAMSPVQMERALIPLEQQPLTPTRLEQILSHRIAQDLRQEGFGSDGSNSPNSSDNDRKASSDPHSKEAEFSGFFVKIQNALSYFASDEKSQGSLEENQDSSSQDSSDSDSEARYPLRFYKSANPEESVDASDFPIPVRLIPSPSDASKYNEMIVPLSAADDFEKICFPPNKSNDAAERSITNVTSALQARVSSSKPYVSNPSPADQRSSVSNILEPRTALRHSEAQVPLIDSSNPMAQRSETLPSVQSRYPSVPLNYINMSMTTMHCGTFYGIEPYSPMSMISCEPGFASWMSSNDGHIIRQPKSTRHTARHDKPLRSRSTPIVTPPLVSTGTSPAKPKPRSRVNSIFSIERLRGSLRRLRSMTPIENYGAAADSGTELAEISPLHLHEWTPGLDEAQQRVSQAPQRTRHKSEAEHRALERQRAREAETPIASIPLHSIFEPQTFESRQGTKSSSVQPSTTGNIPK